MNDTDIEVPSDLLALELAWGIIANAYGGNWSLASDEWRTAAENWRDNHWHTALDRARSN